MMTKDANDNDSDENDKKLMWWSLSALDLGWVISLTTTKMMKMATTTTLLVRPKPLWVTDFLGVPSVNGLISFATSRSAFGMPPTDWATLQPPTKDVDVPDVLKGGVTLVTNHANLCSDLGK